MKALYIILGLALALLVLYGSAAVQFTAMACAFGWYFYERTKAKRYER